MTTVQAADLDDDIWDDTIPLPETQTLKKLEEIHTKVMSSMSELMERRDTKQAL